MVHTVYPIVTLKNKIITKHSCLNISIDQNHCTEILQVSDIKKDRGEGISNQPLKEDLESSNIEVIPQDANHSSLVRIKRQD